MSCGKKGPPLAPRVIAPDVVSDVSASRFGDQVIVRFTLPDKNSDNSTPVDLARIDVYALSVADAAEVPDATEVVREGARVGSIELAKKPEAVADEGTGPRTFSETLTAEARVVRRPNTPATTAPAPGLTAAARARALVYWIGPIGTMGSGLALGERPPEPVRLYAFVPVSGRGRRGVPSTVAVPLADPPPAPAPPVVTYTETAIVLAWIGVEKAAGYNVYERGPSGSSGSWGSVPLNEAPVKEPSFRDKRLEFDKARCYSVTAVATVATRRIESPMSDPACVTPVDTFPPAAPTGLAAVPGSGAVSLIWDAVPAPDLAGYLVLRGDAPDGTLQALTPEPIKDTTYRDAAVTPGTRYAYAVIAVDRSKNRSAPSSKVEETAR